MSFFSQPPGGLPEDPEPKRQPPPWFEPPIGVLPGLLPNRLVLVKSERVLLVIDQLRVYPSGMLFTFNLFLRNANEEFHYGMPWEPHHPRQNKPDDRNLLRFGLQFSDGRTWTNTAPSMPDFENEPIGPVVTGQGGGGGGHRWAMSYWLWPLPQPGDLTFVVDWAAFDIAEASATINAQDIIDTAAAAEIVWTE